VTTNQSLTAVPGIEVGHAHDERALTGCTVVLCRKGASAGIDVRGGAPGTRETDLLGPVNLVQKAHAIMIAGGSAFGLAAADGAMRYLEERNIGFQSGAGRVPIVPAAIIFDLDLGDGLVRPDAAMGYLACRSASRQPVIEGNVGAGTGASVGKILGLSQAMKAGIGSAAISLRGNLKVGALAVVNAFGDVIDSASGSIIAGVRSRKHGRAQFGVRGYFADTLVLMRSVLGRTILRFASRSNTVLGVVAVNASFTKTEMTKIAQMAQDGVARSIRPAHTLLDGDVMFALATGGPRADVTTVGSFAAEAMAQAIVRAARTAVSAGGLPGLGSAARARTGLARHVA
jgi:L-aminopeptidase/D-esterase-like protein